MKKYLVISLSLLMLVAIIVMGNSHFKKQQENLIVVSTDKNLTKEEFTIPNDKIYVYSFNGKINIYIKGSKENSNRYVGYHIRNFKNELNENNSNDDLKTNYDVWNISYVDEYERRNEETFINIKNIVREGEWDLALKEEGANDFIGGTQHGDEITTDYTLFVDGEQKEINKMFKSDVDELKFTATSDLYRDNSITESLEKIGTSKKTYIFDVTGLTVEREINFETDMHLEKSYLAMLPILRDSQGEKITDTIITNIHDEEYDVSEAGFSIPEIRNIPADKVIIFGKDSGISAEVEILEKTPEFGVNFKISNSDLYNKLYFSFNEKDYSVSAGEVWTQKTHYKIDTLN